MHVADRAVRPGASEEVRRIVGEHLRANTPRLAELMTREIIARIPEFARPGEQAYVRTIRHGVDHALSRFQEMLDGRATPASGWRDLYWEIGAGELREGRSLDAMHAAIRLCARIGWRQLIDDADRAGVPLRELGPFAESIFGYLDEIADASAQGYAHAKAAEVGELERRRRRLLALLTASPPSSVETVAAAAVAARWQVPGRVAAVVLDSPVALSTPPVLPPDILADFERTQPCLIVANPVAGRQVQDLNRHLSGYRAAVGPPVAYLDAAKSLRWAAQALDLARRDIIPDPGIVWCRDHLSTLALFQDEELLDALVERRLAPLLSRPPRQREALADTLLAWLQANGNANRVALDLHIHPQTARQRLRQVMPIFGDALGDAHTRFELQIALRAHLRGRERQSTQVVPQPQHQRR